MKIVLIRHGETDANADGKMHSRSDATPLNSRGRIQANSLILPCMDMRVEYVFSSPARRAVETAHILAHGIRRGMEILPEFAERDWGEWSGRTWPEVQSELEKLSLDDRYHFLPPNGESWEQMDLRLAEGLKKVERKPFETIALVAHEGVLRALIPLMKRAPKETSFFYTFDNGSITVMESYPDGRYHETMVNNTDHVAPQFMED